MRKFLCIGGSHDGAELNIKHGNAVLMASTGESYRVYSEPVGHYLGALVPSSASEKEVIRLLEEKLPWFKGKP